MRRSILRPVAAAVAALTLLTGCGAVSVLPDGRVLLVEGAPGRVWDPATGDIVPTGAMAVDRQLASWTVLPDGRVLAAGGGEDATQPLTSAELFDPVTLTWSPTGELTAAREAHQASVLPDGRVLVTGGSKGEDMSVKTLLASTELFDPATGTFAEAAPMVGKRALHTQVTLQDGRVLVAFGDGGEKAPPTAEIWDPADGTWSATGAPGDPRFEAAAALLPDGRVLIAGGLGASDLSGNSTTTPTAVLFDPATGTFTPTGDMAVARAAASAVTLPDGRVLIVGGISDVAAVTGGEAASPAPGGPSAMMAELYDPATGTFTATGALHQPLIGLGTLLADGRVLYAGASMASAGQPTSWFASGETWDPATGEWTEVNLATAP